MMQDSSVPLNVSQSCCSTWATLTARFTSTGSSGRRLPQEHQDTDQFCVLPHYLVQNTAHVTVLLEAGGLERHSDLFRQFIRMCVVAMPDGESHPIACVCSSDGITSRLELIRRIELEGDRLNWLAHSATLPSDLGQRGRRRPRRNNP